MSRLIRQLYVCMCLSHLQSYFHCFSLSPSLQPHFATLLYEFQYFLTLYSYLHNTPNAHRPHPTSLIIPLANLKKKEKTTNTKSSQQTIQSIHILDTSRIIEEPPKLCVISGGFCCNGFHFDIEPNETISYNDTLHIYNGGRFIGNITKLRHGCQLRGSRPVYVISMQQQQLQQQTIDLCLLL